MHISLAAETLINLWGFPLTNSLLHAVLVSLTLMGLGLLVRRTGYRTTSLFYVAVEWAAEGIESLVKGVVSNAKVATRVLPYAGTIFVFILLCNWSGIMPLVGSVGFERPAEHAVAAEHATPAHESQPAEHAPAAAEHGETEFVPLFRSAYSDLNMTLAIALLTMVLVQVFGFQALGASYLSKFFSFKNPIMAFVGLLELLSEFVKIFSFSFRLFGNIFAGEVLLTVIGSLVPFVGPVPFLGIELFAGAIQALIFTMLSLVFIGGAATAHEGHDEHGHAAHPTPAHAT